MKHIRRLLVIGVLLFFSIPTFVQSDVTITTIAEGLYNPVGLALLPDGGILIAEEGTGKKDASAGVSLLTSDGKLGRLISGFPSSRDSGDLSGIALVAVSPDEETIYFSHFNAQKLFTLPVSAAESLPEHPYTQDDVGTAMERLNNVFLLNPYDMTFDADGVPVVSDASGNGVAKELPTGKTRFFHRFDKLKDPSDERLSIEAVPTGITRVGDEYYVTLLGGCPYPSKGGELVAIDEERNQRIIVDNLNMPIDVEVGADGTIWVLEFAKFTPGGSCFSGMGYQANTGRLSRLMENGELETVVNNLDFPGAVLPMPDGSLYITEIFDGRIRHIEFDEETAQSTTSPKADIPEPVYAQIDDMDAALQAVINREGLTAYPGQDLIEGDTPLAQLGQDLFFDPILSGDQNTACATCHHPSFAMADGRVLPIGVGGQGLGEDRYFLPTLTISNDTRYNAVGEIANPFLGQFVPRNSPTVINSALLTAQFWDGRVQNYALGDPVKTLESDITELGLTDALVTQALFPITSMHEMAGATFGEEPPRFIRERLVERLENQPEYAQRFAKVFGTDTITPVEIVQAIGAFERQFIFTKSPWDDYIAGDDNALTDQQKRGALLFWGELSEGVNCSTCHSGDLLTDMDFHNILAPQIGPGKGNGDNKRDDFGRSNVTFDYRDQYTFRTPGLRNVTLTAPYLHSGAYQTLHDTIWHHADIWTSNIVYDPASNLPPAYYSSLFPYDPIRQGHSVAPELANGLPLTEQDVIDLVAYLESLTDPAATDLTDTIPTEVPSGLPLDPVPTEKIDIPILSNQATIRNEIVPEPQSTEWNFENVASQVGLDFIQDTFQQGLYADPSAMMGAGLCWIDYDKDGWFDLYLVNSYAEDEINYWQANGGLPTNALYRNVEGQFVDVSHETGTDLSMRGNGCVSADLNNDGWDDLYVTADGDNALLYNNGDGTFTEGAQTAGIAAPEWNSATAVADLNHDGWLDLFVGGYIDLNNKVPNPVGAFPQDYFGIPDHLYLSNGADSNGNLTFTDVTREAGLLIDERTLGSIFVDADNDGDLDLYIANDGQPNRLYIYEPADNVLGFRLMDTYETSNVNDRGSGMGVTSGDWDGNGWADLMVTNWDVELNAIYRNRTGDFGYPFFEYCTYRIGVRGLGNNMTGWGVHFADFDQDTDLDLMTVNGRVPITNPEMDAEWVRMYTNQMMEGNPNEFREWTALVGLRDVGTLMARGSAAADYDNDGDLDVAINQISGPAVLLENHVPEGNWLILELSDVQPGTRIEAYLPDGRILQRDVHIGSSYLASEDPRVHFGLGTYDTVTEIRITYPTGESTALQNVAANQFVSVADAP